MWAGSRLQLAGVGYHLPIRTHRNAVTASDSHMVKRVVFSSFPQRRTTWAPKQRKGLSKSESQLMEVREAAETEQNRCLPALSRLAGSTGCLWQAAAQPSWLASTSTRLTRRSLMASSAAWTAAS